MSGVEFYLPLLMFVTLLLLLMLGYPVAFTLAGCALGFAGIGYAFDLFYLSDLGFIPAKVFGIVENITLVAVPLFIFMGLVLEKSGIAEDMLHGMTRFLRRSSGSLGYTVVGVGAVMAASTGIVGATVVTMGVLTLPVMLAQGYDRRLACGTIAAAGTLGQIIPPSIVLVLLGDIMNVDVADLFMAALGPGCLLIGLYIGYLWFCGRLKPEWVPQGQALATPSEIQSGWIFVIPIALVVVVLGSILGGLASPTEAAGCGAMAALLIALIQGRLSRQVLDQVCQKTAKITAMVFSILLGAQFFGVVFRGIGGDEVIAEVFQGLNLSKSGSVIFLMALLFLLGCFLDFLEICFIVIPIVLPLFSALGLDPLWLSVMIAVNLQTSFLTPPFGFALFYLKGVAPKEVQTTDIYRGVWPFVLLQLAALILLGFFPGIVTALPRWLNGL